MTAPSSGGGEGPGGRVGRQLTRRAVLCGTGSGALAALGGCATLFGRGRPPDTVTIEYVDVAGARTEEMFRPIVDTLDGRSDASVDLEFVEIPYGDLKSHLYVRLGGDREPDVAAIDQIWLGSLIASGSLMRLDGVADRIDFEDYLAPFRRTVVHDGHVYGFPITTDVRGMYWDREGFAAAGLDPDRPPRTWEELFEVAEQLHDPPKTYGAVSFVNGGRWTVPLFSAGGAVLDGGEPAFHEPPGVRAAEFLDRLYNHSGVGPPEPVYESGAELARQFLTGRYAIDLVEGSWLEYFWENLDREGAIDERYGFAPTPAPADGEPATMSGGFVWTGFESTDHPELVREFLALAAGREFKRHLARESGAIPTRASLQDDAGVWEGVTYAGPIRDLLEVTRLRPVSDWPTVADALDPALQRVAFGRQAPARALATAADRVRAAID